MHITIPPLNWRRDHRGCIDLDEAAQRSDEKKCMTGRKLLGAEQSAKRKEIIVAAASLIREQGYAAASAREIAKQAGLKHQLIFYYFDDLNHLLIEVYRDHASRWLERLRVGLKSATPLRAFWATLHDPVEQVLVSEFMALAQRNTEIRAELVSSAEQARGMLMDLLEQDGRTPINLALSPIETTMVISALARQLLSEKNAGVELGHPEGEALMVRLLEDLEPSPQC